MCKRFSVLAILLGLLCMATLGQAQVFFSNTRVGSTVQTHATVSTTTAAAISAASVAGGLLAWKLCNDAINTSTYLYVGKASDVATDGVQLAPGGCFDCPNCNAATLKLIRVKAQAASNGYSIVQYKQQ